jgi:hypothetical protein
MPRAAPAANHPAAPKEAAMSTTHAQLAASATLVLAAALLAGGCDLLSDAGASPGGGGGGSTGGGDIVAACRTYSDALQRGDWPAAAELLTGRQRQQWEQVWRQALNDSRLVKSRSTVYGEPAVRGDTAVVRATGTTLYNQSTEATLGRTKLTVVQEITLQRIDGKWKIAAIDTISVR